MFDRARCLDPSRLTASPFVSMDALSALSDLLLQALKKPPRSSSNAPHFSASRSSHDQNRGEAHDHAKPGTTASDAGRTAKADGDTSKAREIVMFTFRTLQPSRLAMLSVFAVGSAMSSSSQRRPPAIVRPGLRGSRAGVLRRSSSGHQNFAWCLVHGTSSTLRLRFRLGPAPFALASLMNNWSVGPRPLQRKTTVSSSRRARLGLQAIIASISQVGRWYFFIPPTLCSGCWLGRGRDTSKRRHGAFHRGMKPSVSVCMKLTSAFSSSSESPSRPTNLVFMLSVDSGAGQHVVPSPGLLGPQRRRTSRVL